MSWGFPFSFDRFGKKIHCHLLGQTCNRGVFDDLLFEDTWIHHIGFHLIVLQVGGLRVEVDVPNWSPCFRVRHR